MIQIAPSILSADFARIEEAVKIAESDPYVTSGARTLEVFEWDMKVTLNK